MHCSILVELILSVVELSRFVVELISPWSIPTKKAILPKENGSFLTKLSPIK